MSPDTKAIIDRLKREGDLFRNSGTNSIKSVKADLSKFNETFAAIGESMQGITGGIQKQTKLEELRDEKQFKLEQIQDENERKKYEEQEEKNLKVQQQIETDRLKEDRKKQLEANQRELKIFGKDGIFASTLKSTFNLVKNILFYGIVGAIGYEVLAGAIEALAPKIFGKDVELPTLFEGFANAGKAFGKLTAGDWDGFVNNIKYLAQPAVQLGAGLLAAKGAEVAVKGAVELGTNYLTFAALSKMLTPGPADAEAGLTRAKVTKGAIRGGIAGLIFAGLFAGIDPIMNWFRKSGGMSDEDIVNAPLALGDQIAGVGGAATIAALLVPGGPFVKAAAGIGMFLIGAALKTLDYLKDDDALPNKIEDLHRTRLEADDQLAKYLELRKKALQLGEDPEEINKRIKELQDEIAEMSKPGYFTESISEKETLIATERDALDEFRKNKDKFIDDQVAIPTDPLTGAPIAYAMPAASSRAEAEANYLARVEEYLNKIETAQNQIDGTVKLATESYGLTIEDLGVVRNRGMQGRFSSVEAFNAYEEKRKRDAAAAQKEAEFQKYLEDNDIQFEGTFTDAILQSMKEDPLGLNRGAGNIILNSTPQYNSPISLNVGGSRSATSIIQGFNSGGNSDAFCPFPGAASN